MVLERSGHWRVFLLVAGAVAVAVMWGMSIFGEAIPHTPSELVFSSPVALTLWIALGVGNLLFLLSFYGSKPDIFLLLVPFGVIINILGSNLATLLKLPFYLDTVGTIVAAIVGGPALGMLTAGVTSMMWGVYYPNDLPHVLAAVMIALVVALAARKLRLKTILNVMAVGLIMGVVAALISSVTVLFALGGTTAVGAHSLMHFFVLIHFSEPVSLLLQEFISEPLDKTFCLIGAALLVRYVPERIRRLFIAGENELALRLVFRKIEDLDMEAIPVKVKPVKKVGRHRKK